MRLQIDDAACVFSGVCASLAPHRFAVTDDTTVVVDADVPGDAADRELVDDAVACCPAAAISLVDSPAAAAAPASRRTP